MASLVISAAGAAIGYMAAGPAGAKWGWMLGAMAASSMVDGPVTEGPRLSDLRVTSSTQGVGMNKVYGTLRIGGNIIWSQPLTETRLETEQSGGGKGGGSAKNVQYTYTQTFAVALCEGPIFGIRRMWMNNKLVYNVAEGASVETIAASNAEAEGWTLHLGSNTQNPDPTIEAVLGVGNTPAYRDTAYIVFTDLLLTDYGNRTPNIEVEVVCNGVYSTGNPDTDLTVYAPSAPLAEWGSTPHYRQSSLWVEGGAVFALLWGGALYKDSGAGFVYLRTLPLVVDEYDNSDAVIWERTHAWQQSNVVQLGGWNYVLAQVSGNVMRWVKFNETTEEILTHGSPGRAYGSFHNFGGTIVRVGGWVWSVTYSTYVYTAVVDHTTDLINWTADTNAPGAGSYIYTEHKGELYAVGAYDQNQQNWVIKSTDGVNWTSVFSAPLGFFANGGYGSLAEWGTAVWSDGTTLWYMRKGFLYTSTDDGVTFTFVDEVDASILPARQPIGRNPTAMQGNYLYMLSIDGLSYPANATVVSRKYSVIPSLALVDPTVEEIVTEAATQVGVSVSGTSALSDTIRGFVVQGRRTPRSVIEALQQVFYFDAVESGGSLKFVKRGGASALTIPEADLAAHDEGSEMPDNMQTVLKQELDLPHEISLGYLEAESDYAQAVQYARRLTGSAQNAVNATTAVVLSAAKARQVAEVALWNAWMGRATFTIAVSRKYAYLEPTDVVAIVKGAATHIVRIIGKREDGGVIQFDLVREDATVYTQSPPAASLTVTSGTVTARTATRGDLMDIPLLRDTDDGAGFYAAFSPTTTPYRWDGAGLYRSVDGGATWAAYGPSATTLSVLGNASSVLGSFSAGNIFDEQNTVTVTVLAGSLSSVTEALVLAGANMALLGDEIIQFKNATLVGTLTYELSGLLRGCRGTEYAMGSHSSSDRFVLLTDSTTYRAVEPTSEIGLTRQFKPVTYGTDIALASTTSFTNTGASLKPLAPVHIGGGRDASGNLEVHWTRRSRLGGEWRDNVDVGVGEASEAYDVDVMNGGTVVRTLTATSSTVAYTAAQQTTDFGSPQSSVTVRVYQRSAVIGRGFPGIATI